MSEIIWHYETELPSTNTKAAELARAGCPALTAVICDRQTAGRGRMGRSFFSPENGLYLSAVLRPTKRPDAYRALTAYVCHCVAGALETLYGVRSGIKWVNDLYLHGRKVCGILCESILGQGGYFDAVIVGIGVNLGPEDFPEELREIAGSVLSAGDYRPGERRRLAEEILRRLAGYEDALEQGDFMDAYRARLLWLGEPVRVIRGESARDAVALSVDRYAALRVRYEDGSEEELVGGEITLRPRKA